MPCRSWSLPTYACISGSRLAHIKNSVCSSCYATKGAYRWPSTINAQTRRLLHARHPQWVEAMVTLINHYSRDYFRWFDSGDLQDMEMLNKIFEVCRQTPETQHWLPTQERRMVKHVVPPPNLVIRVSSPIMEVPLISSIHWTTSMVMKHPDPSVGYICPATTIRHKCEDCRACWDAQVDNIIYKRH